jgi:hypothetical protein
MSAPSEDASPSSNDVMAALNFAPHELQTCGFAHSGFDVQCPLLVFAPRCAAMRPHIEARYPTDLEARVALEGGAGLAPLTELPPEASAWLLPALQPEQDVRGLAGLHSIVERLFSPNVCPWEQAQTLETLATYFIEESCSRTSSCRRRSPSRPATSASRRSSNTSLASWCGAIHTSTATWTPTGPRRSSASGSGSRPRSAPNATHANRPPRAESALDSVPTFTPSFVRSDQLIDRAERVGLGAPPESAREQLAVAITALEDPPDAAAVGALLWAHRSPRTRRRDRHGAGWTPRRERLHRVLQSG